MFKKVRVVLFLLCLFAVGCATQATKVYEKHSAPGKLMPQGHLVVEKDVVVLDARPAFEYAVTRVPGSINIDWREFSADRHKKPGPLHADLYGLTRRLARLGIGPETSVLILGRGTTGEGEEGRLAWTLHYLGVKNVNVAGFDAYKGRLTAVAESKPPEPVTAWRPRINPPLLATREELIMAATRKIKGPVHILDVRTTREYLAKEGLGSDYVHPEVGAINIPWTEFLDGDGRPNFSLREKLIATGVEPGHRVIVMSNRGVRSAAVVMALLAMGYTNVGNLN